MQLNYLAVAKGAVSANWLWKHGKSSKEIDNIMTDKRGYCVNRICASEGSGIKRKLIQDAKKRFVIAAVASGIGIRPTACAVPPALGTCSPALVSKIMKAEKIHNQSSNDIRRLRSPYFSSVETDHMMSDSVVHQAASPTLAFWR